jgi:hypothetical protein
MGRESIKKAKKGSKYVRKHYSKKAIMKRWKSEAKRWMSQ